MYPKNRRSAPCAAGCQCGKHRRRVIDDETRARMSAAAKARGFNHADSCSCVWCGTNPACTRHGETSRSGNSVEYNTWQSLVARCTNPNNPEYANYGGRGITVCSSWRTFENFLADLGRRPGPNFSIERIDNSRGYEPGNCRWATRSEQARNTRRTRLSEEAVAIIRSSSETAVALADRFGAAPSTVGCARRGETWR